MDFQDVPNWQANKLDRTTSSRMGWSDVSLSLSGPVVEDLKTHFAQRWNFIYNEKYHGKNESSRYSLLPEEDGRAHHHRLHGEMGQIGDHMRDRVEEGFEHVQARHFEGREHPRQLGTGAVPCQIMRSCTKWSHGVPLEVR